MSVVTVLPDACKHIKANTTPTRSSFKGMESIYTITPTSSKFSVLSRRKTNQKNNRDRNPTLVPAVSEIKQRVMSARMLRIKQLQNQIGEAQHRIAELAAENRLLKSLHKRQDSALSKYENSNAELPQLLHSHSEELRMWQTRCRNLQRQNKELQEKLKQKETILLTMNDQNKHLLQLNKDKNLLERASLQERVKVLEQRCMDKENELKLFARRFELETKVYRTNLHMEQQKYRDLVNKIEMSDLVLMQSNKKSKQKSLYNKSPLNRLNLKSAVSVSHVNSDKDLSAGVSPTSSTILPPCSNDSEAKKNDENAKQTSLCVNNNDSNSNMKLDDENDEVFDSNEIDLTKNCIDKSDEYNGTTCHDETDEIIRVKNAMSRARQQQKKAEKTGTKLSPLHPENQAKSLNVDSKSDKKSLSNDSELSDDEDFQFFSNHNGTKTAPIINARELLDHKMHINELEEKMKKNSLDENVSNIHQCSINVHQCSYLPKTANSSTLSSNDDDITSRNDEISRYSINTNHHVHITSFSDRGDNDLLSMQRELRESHLNRESILDEYCETIYDDDKTSRYSENTVGRFRRIEFNREVAPSEYSDVISTTCSFSKSPCQANNYIKSNGHARNGRKEINGGGKPSKLDEAKKTRLLALLKNIDVNRSEEN